MARSNLIYKSEIVLKNRFDAEFYKKEYEILEEKLDKLQLNFTQYSSPDFNFCFNLD